MRGSGDGDGPDLIFQVHHGFTGTEKVWGAINVTHMQGDVESDEGVGIIRIRREDKN